ncbi:MAG: protein kinase, partial [Gemmatimonadota bacterium]
MDLRAQLQAHFGTAFVIERELGGGGMSRVFVANEVRLSRQVVVKVLNPILVQGLNADRFEREILLVASLQQANIVPVLSTGDVEGIPYYTMPYVEGESLRSRLAGTGLGIGDTIAILRDVTRALAYAHSHGVVHRDIKPDNVLLSGGTAVVTDFGIAKAVADSKSADAPAGSGLTQTGTSIGTPLYMAPEQVAGDPSVDQRADLYSLGCMAFELLTGKSPFADRAPQRVLAAHLSEVPPPVSTLRPDCPAALSDLVARLMEKDPANRPQSAADVLSTLDTVVSSSAPTLSQPPAGMFQRALIFYLIATAVVALLAKAAVVAIGLPDWVFPGAMIVMLLGLPALLVTGYVQRVRRHVYTATPTMTPGGTITPKVPTGTMATMALKASPHVTFRRTARAGAIAMTAFVMLIAGFMTLRALGIGAAGSLFASGKLAADDRIVLAEFTVSKEDSALAPILMEAVRAAVSQSKSIRLLAPTEVAGTLEQMQRNRDTPLDLTLAREVAARTGAKGVLTGHVARIGNGFAVSLELMSPEAGAPLASFQASANGPGDLLTVVDGLSRKLRGKIGESLKAVQRSVPLEQATTASLEALRKYSDAVKANDVDQDYDRAVKSAREAVALDSTFALAWRKLYVALLNSNGALTARDSALDRAAHFAGKLPDREKNQVLGAYYSGSRTAADRGKAMAAYQAVYAADSTSSVAANQLTQLFTARRQYDSAQRYAVKQLQLQPTVGIAAGLAGLMVTRNRLDEAAALLDSVTRTATITPANYTFTFARAELYRARGQHDSADRLMTPLLDSPIVAARAGAQWDQEKEALTDGRLIRAMAIDSARSALLISRGVMAQFDGLIPAVVDITWRSKREDGARRLDAIVAGKQWAAADPKDRPYEFIAKMYAFAGQPGKAQALWTRWAAEDPGAHAPASRSIDTAIRGEIALAEGTYEEAVRLFRASDVGEDGAPTGCENCIYGALARTFDRAGQKDSTIAYLERYLAVPQPQRDEDYVWLGSVERRLGELYDERNDRDKAAAHYQAFVDLWRNADPDMQVSVSKVKTRLGELV